VRHLCQRWPAIRLLPSQYASQSLIVTELVLIRNLRQPRTAVAMFPNQTQLTSAQTPAGLYGTYPTVERIAPTAALTALLPPSTAFAVFPTDTDTISPASVKMLLDNALQTRSFPTALFLLYRITMAMAHSAQAVSNSPSFPSLPQPLPQLAISSLTEGPYKRRLAPIAVLAAISAATMLEPAAHPH
jgi:hypothetical protein